MDFAWVIFFFLIDICNVSSFALLLLIVLEISAKILYKIINLNFSS